MGVCSQLVYNRNALRTKLHVCHLHGLGASYPKHAIFCWSLCANNSRLISKCAWHSNTIYPKHLLLHFLVGHELVGVNPLGRCAVVVPLPHIAKLPKKSQNNGFKICELIWVLLIWRRVTSCHFKIWRWFAWTCDQKTNPNQKLKMLPLKT